MGSLGFPQSVKKIGCNEAVEARISAHGLIPMDYDFEQFWAAFPKRAGANPKAAARKIWDRLVKFRQMPPMDQVMTATREFALECVRTKSYGTTFVPHARTWLNQRRFESDAVTVEAPVVTKHEAVLPAGYEDAARALIKQIGVARYNAFFGKATWSNGGNVIKIKASSRFDAQTIEINYVEELERLTGKTVEVMA
jgi:hypothetical protein